ncbi:MobV family relaxase [Clostridium botulinum]|nr:MobV family relaxase [Clostridium botulinum]APC82150.1 plasmid recombination enzyme family protein [Clostridium botulinum]AXG97739.1 plasmid recombination protein [Clostridium botulinum]EDT79959.1 plasmid recombination enzyme [Clostridium botulinum NCTC 2916]MBY6773822.1 plasmid recombination protein [Clostridium botulinum]MBY6777353.1 plasmid recombination protein [Clostridium botulinum]
MSYLVCTMKKMKKDNLFGLQKHNQRESENHNNKDIDKNKSDLNYDLVNENKINLSEKVFDLIEKIRESEKAIRKDAVLLDEFIISSDRDFFKNMNENEIKKFFETSKQFFAERYGEENIISANVHLDETTPHMHLDVCPLRNGRLQSKNIFTRNELRNIQEELPKTLKNNGFEIERGVKGSTQKHIDIQTLKAREEKKLKELKEKNKEIELKIASRKEKLEEVKDLDFQIKSKKTVLNNLNQGNDCLDEDIKYKLDGFDVKMDYVEFRKFQTQIASIKKVKKENEDLKNENSIVHKKCSDLRKSQEEVSSRFTNWIDNTYKHMSLDSREQFKRRGSESLANGSTGNYDEDSTLDKSVMDSKAFNEDVYIKCANEKENALKEPKMSSNGFEIDW